jgi:hypothetical protein
MARSGWMTASEIAAALRSIELVIRTEITDPGGCTGRSIGASAADEGRRKCTNMQTSTINESINQPRSRHSPKMQHFASQCAIDSLID